MDDRTRLQAAAAQYPYLRGLLAVPGGALFVIAALGNWKWGPLRYNAVFIGVVAVIAAAAAVINRYYNERYGRVTPSREQSVKAALAIAAGAGLITLGSLLLRSRASWSLDLPVNPIPATFGLLMVVYYSALVGLKAHHAVIWGALIVVGLLPVWNGGDPSNVGLVITGVAVAVNGIFDHRLLTRLLADTRAHANLNAEHAGR